MPRFVDQTAVAGAPKDYRVRAADGQTSPSNVITMEYVPSTNTPTTEHVIWAVGDADDTTNSRAVVDRIVKDGLTSFVRLYYNGDIYPDGSSGDWANNFLTDGSGVTVWGKIPETQRRHSPGNHDWEHGNSSEYLRRVPSSLTNGKTYKHDKGDMGVWESFTMNSSISMQPGTEQFDRLTTFLSTPGTTKFVQFHKPRYTGGSHSNNTDADAVVRACAGKAAFILQGHDHNMQLFQPVKGGVFTDTRGRDTNADVDGVTTLVIGAGGHGLYTPADRTAHEFKAVTYGALKVTFIGASAKLEFIRASDGAVLKTKTIHATAPDGTTGGGTGTTVATPKLAEMDWQFNSSPQPGMTGITGNVTISGGFVKHSLSSTARTTEYRSDLKSVTGGAGIVLGGATLSQFSSGSGEIYDTFMVDLNNNGGTDARLRRHITSTSDRLEFRIQEGTVDPAQFSIATPAGIKALKLGLLSDHKTVIAMYSTDWAASNPGAATWVEVGQRSFPTASFANGVQVVRRVTFPSGTGVPTVSSADALYGTISPFGGSSTSTKRNETQTITLTNATGGTYRLNVAIPNTSGSVTTEIVPPPSLAGGTTVPALEWNASAATIQTALEGHAELNVGDVTVTGAAGGPYTVEFTGKFAGVNIPEMFVPAEYMLLTGTSPTIAVATTQEGGTLAPGTVARTFNGSTDYLQFGLAPGATGQTPPAWVSSAVQEFAESATANTVTVTGTSGQYEIHTIQTSGTQLTLTAETYTTNGWTRLAIDNPNPGDQSSWVYGKTLTATETAPSYTLSSTTNDSQVSKTVVSGQNGDPTITSLVTASSSSAGSTAITASSDNSLLVSLIVVDGSDTHPSPFFTHPSGMTERLDFKGRLTTDTPGGSALLAGAATQAVNAGSYSPTWGLATSDSSHVYNLVFNPLPGTGGTGTAAGAVEDLSHVYLLYQTTDSTESPGGFSPSAGALGRFARVDQRANNTATPGWAVWRDEQAGTEYGDNDVTVPLNAWALVAVCKSAAGNSTVRVWRKESRTFIHSDVPPEAPAPSLSGPTIPGTGTFMVGAPATGQAALAFTGHIVAAGWTRKVLSVADFESMVDTGGSVTMNLMKEALSEGVNLNGATEEAHLYRLDGTDILATVQDLIGTLHQSGRSGTVASTLTDVPFSTGSPTTSSGTGSTLGDPKNLTIIDGSNVLDVTDTTKGQVSLTWEGAGTSYSIVGVELDDSGETQEPVELATATTAGTTASPFILGGLNLAVTTRIQVIAKTATEVSGPSEPVLATFTVTPVITYGAVQNFTATGVVDGFVFAWDARPDIEQITAYEIEVRRVDNPGGTFTTVYTGLGTVNQVGQLTTQVTGLGDNIEYDANIYALHVE